jgi:superkiller protein 3
VEKYRKVIDLPAAEEADQANAWAALGVLNYIRKIYNEAITQSRKALDLNPAHRFAYRTCGDVFYQRKQYAEAASLYEKHITQAAQTDVNSYLVWGAALLAAKKEAEAIQKYEQAIAMDADTESSLAERYYYWGNALTGENRIEEGIEKYRKANSIAPDYVYAHHNLAFYLQAQGRYSESWAKWEETIPIYRRGIEEARKNGNSEYFRYFGGVLVDLKHPDAEDVYLQGLELNPDYLDILTDLVGLYLDQRDELVKPDHRPDHHGRTRANSKARECYRKAEELLKRDFALAEDPWIFVQWGQLYVNMGEYDKAAVQFQKAVEQDSESAEPLNQLGVLFSRKEDFAKAIQYFEQALQRDPDNLMIKNNLAEAYLKGGKLDKAEAEYKRILSITANHVESEIGLGQVYTAMAEGCRDGDFYDEAIHHFKRAIDMAKNNSSKVSKKMTSQEWAAVYYASGYARVKLHGSSKTIKDDRLLWDARKDFKQSLNYDKEHHKAERAAKKITEKLRPFSPERFLEKVGPMTILAMSAFVFVLVQISFLRKGMFHDLAFYVPVTFGSIILMIAGFYLPRLLKLKVAGIELEKSSVDQITSAGSVEISQ